MGLLDDLLAGTTGQSMGGQPMRDQPVGSSVQGAPAGGMQGVLMALLPVVLAMLASRRGGAPQADVGRGAGSGGLGGLLGELLSGRQGAGGGLGDLLAQLQRGGFGAQAQSWVGRGQNLPLPSDALEQVFGRGGLAEIARQVGVSEADASRGLSQLLPEVVDHVTPDGQVPDADVLTASVDALARRYGLA